MSTQNNTTTFQKTSSCPAKRVENKHAKQTPQKTKFEEQFNSVFGSLK